MKVNCERCCELLWDHLYELLEAEQAQMVRAHLADCAVCRAALRVAERQRDQIAQVARLDIEVPLFGPPESEPAVLPFHKRASRIVRGAVAAAAMLLLTVGLPFSLYEWGARTRSANFGTEFAAFDTARKERETLSSRAQADLESAFKAAPAHQLRVQVVGPARILPGAANPHHVRVTDLEGKPVDADIVTRIIAADNREVYRATGRTTQGTLLVTLPDGLADLGPSPRLEVAATATDARGQLREALQVGEPELLTHLTLAKVLYQPGDVLFFRSVTVDRFSLTPVPAGMQLRYALKNAQGEAVREMTTSLGEGGIGGGALQLPRERLAEGEYTLTVADAEGRFAPQSRRIQVAADRPVNLKKVLEFDQPSYKPGDTVRATVRAQRIKDGEAVAGKLVTTTLKVDGKPFEKAVRGKTDAQGVARIEMPLPPRAARSFVLSVVISDQPAERIEREIPLVAPALAVEFFPEGGNLVAELENRVYLRARIGDEPAEVRGTLFDNEGYEICAVQTTRQTRGLGRFSFMPGRGKAYTLRLEGTATTRALPAVRDAGVRLIMPEGVVRAKEDLALVVQTSAETRDLVVAAFCRGRLVAYRPLPAASGQYEVRLTPPADLGGVFRITVFEEQHGLRPVAERLAYRQPGKRLQFAVEADTKTTTAGDHVRMTLRTQKEAGTLVPAWVLASVVDRESAGLDLAGGPPTLAAHFQLLGDLHRPEDLEDADFLLGEHPDSAALLDLYLGTQGWRRLTDGAVAQGEGAAKSASVGLIKLDNTAQAWHARRASLSPNLNRIQQEAATHDQNLRALEQKSHAAVLEAAADLESYQANARSHLRTGLILGLVLLAVLGLLMVRSRVMARGSELLATARPYLAGTVAGGVGGVLLVWSLLLPKLSDPVQAASLVQGHQPRPALDPALPGHVLAAAAVPARSLALLGGNDPVHAPHPLALAQLETLVERRVHATNTSGRPLVSNASGMSTAHIASVPPTAVSVKPPPGPVPVVVREYAYLPDPAAKLEKAIPDTVLWSPVLLTKDGVGRIEFVLPRRGATYQLLLQGHDASGRLGSHRTELKATAP